MRFVRAGVIGDAASPAQCALRQLTESDGLDAVRNAARRRWGACASMGRSGRAAEVSSDVCSAPKSIPLRPPREATQKFGMLPEVDDIWKLRLGLELK